MRARLCAVGAEDVFVVTDHEIALAVGCRCIAFSVYDLRVDARELDRRLAAHA